MIHGQLWCTGNRWCHLTQMVNLLKKETLPLADMALSSTMVLKNEKKLQRLGMNQKTIHYHLGKMATLPNSLNTDLSRSFTMLEYLEQLGLLSRELENSSRLFQLQIQNQIFPFHRGWP
jgi:hypothetical protein